MFHCDTIEFEYMSAINVKKLNINRTVIIPKLKN